MREAHRAGEVLGFVSGGLVSGSALLGPLEVAFTGDVLGPRGFGGCKPKQVLEILLVHQGHAVPKGPGRRSVVA
jgi:hypothetical protein